MKIQSLEEYVREISKLKVANGWINGTSILFRGHSNEAYELLPQIGRQIIMESNLTYMAEENALVDESKIKLPGLISPIDSPAIALTKLQHYGIPTRLLDFTENALVALYFACAEKTVNKNKVNGEVLAVTVQRSKIANCFSPFVNTIADTTIMGFLSDMKLREYRNHVSTKKYFTPQNSSQNVSDEHFIDRLFKPIFFTSIEETERQKRQQGIFCIFPNSIMKGQWPGDEGEQWIVNSQISPIKKDNISESEGNFESIYSFVVPQSAKKRILSELGKFGITLSFLFPEPDKICEDIRRKYKERLYSR